MKFRNWLFTMAAVFAFVLVGCQKEADIDTAEMEKAFASASPEIKALAQKVVDNVKAKKFKEALYPLDTLVTNLTLPPAQVQAAQKMAVGINQTIIARKGQ